jgi:hypothetical protein
MTTGVFSCCSSELQGSVIPHLYVFKHSAHMQELSQQRNGDTTVLGGWKHVGWLIASRIKKTVWEQIQRWILCQRCGPHIEEVRGAGGGAIMPPERVHTDELVAPPPLSHVYVPGSMLPAAHEDAVVGDQEYEAIGREGVPGAGPSTSGDMEVVEVIDISGESSSSHVHT